MSGAVAPQILTLSHIVDVDFNKYVNLSFPFRAKIGKIWFTADDRLSGGDLTLLREARLGAVKTHNAKYSGDDASDWALFFGGSDARYTSDETLKPYMWLGDPNDRPEGQVIQYDNTLSNDVNWRSTIATPAPASTPNALFASSSRPYAHVDAVFAAADADNPYWDNWGWSTTGEWNQKKYKTDQSILNQDEFLSLFIYSDGGDWTAYDGTAPVTIFVEYTAAPGPDDSSPTRTWV